MVTFLHISLFFIYAFFGWIIEVAYRSWNRRGFVNAGMLHGPIVPLYGFGALIMIVSGMYTSSYSIVIQYLIFTILLSILEYVTGLLTEKIFHLKLWDYSDNRLNLHGRICLLYSLIWGLLAIFFIYVIHPAIFSLVQKFPIKPLSILTASIIIMFIFDTVISVLSMQEFQKRFAHLSNLLTIEKPDIDSYLYSMRRLLRAFPRLNIDLDLKIRSNIERVLHSQLAIIRNNIASNIKNKKPVDGEYASIVSDIINNPEFSKLREYRHHTSNIYNHAVLVSYLTYRICKYLKLDYISATRGALLHDFFLYDWRDLNSRPYDKSKFHGLEHPKIALENARKHFTLNKIEEDIIVRHMWPLTPRPPRYKESLIVTFTDKYIASKEFIDGIPDPGIWFDKLIKPVLKLKPVKKMK